MSGDRLTAALTDARRRYEVFGEADTFPRLLAALDAVLTLHSAWEIHDGGDGEGPLLYVICRECCAGGVDQTEECAADHHHSRCWPCLTHEAITRALLGEENGNG